MMPSAPRLQKPHVDETEEPDMAGMLEFISPGIENNSKYYGKVSKDKVGQHAGAGQLMGKQRKANSKKEPKRNRGSDSTRLPGESLHFTFFHTELIFISFVISSYFNVWPHCMAITVLTPDQD